MAPSSMRRCLVFYVLACAFALHRPPTAARLRLRRRGVVAASMPPMWPYVGCDGCAPGGAVGLCASLACTGLGLPISEDVLLVSLGARFAALGWAARLAHVAAALVGVVAADLLTVSVGTALRANALSDQAPRFLARFYASVSKQLAFEAKRDGARLRRDLERKLRCAAADVGDAIDAVFRPRLADERPPDAWRLPSRLERVERAARRVTCNTRTALAGAGQATADVFGRVASAEPLGAPTALGAANRASFGQRWPLCLLFGVSVKDPNDLFAYAAGALAAALTVTLPLQLALGALLAPSRALVALLHLGVAFAQLCRFGPLWAALARTIAGTVAEQVADRRKKNAASSDGFASS